MATSAIKEQRRKPAIEIETGPLQSNSSWKGREVTAREDLSVAKRAKFVPSPLTFRNRRPPPLKLPKEDAPQASSQEDLKIDDETLCLLEKRTQNLPVCLKTEKQTSQAFQEEVCQLISHSFHEGKLPFISKGGSARIYDLQYKGKNYAVKVLERQHVHKNTFLREFKIAPQLPVHPNIVTSFFTCNVMAGKISPYETPCLVMEKLPGSVLSNYMGPISCFNIAALPAEDIETLQKRLNHLRAACIDLLSALKIYHDRGLVYRDMKPSNTMVCPVENAGYRLVIFDNGLTRSIHTQSGLMGEEASSDEEIPLTPCGTRAYMVPEVHDSERIFEKKADYGLASDIWNLGTTIYQIAHDKLPFMLSQSFISAQSTLGDCKRVGFEISPNAPDSFREFLLKALEIDPKKRATVDQLLKTDFITGRIREKQDV